MPKCDIDGEGSSNSLYNMLSCSNITKCVDNFVIGSIIVDPMFAREIYYSSVTALMVLRKISNIIYTY